jgi:hypothetical protein
LESDLRSVQSDSEKQLNVAERKKMFQTVGEYLDKKKPNGSSVIGDEIIPSPRCSYPT